MIIQKNKIIAIYLFIYIFLYIVCVSLEQYMQQPLNGVTSYWAAKLWGRGIKLQARKGNQQKQVLRHMHAPFSKPPERGLVGYSCGMGIPRCPYFFLACFNYCRDNLWEVYATFTAYIKANTWLDDPKQSMWRTPFLLYCTWRWRASPRHLSPHFIPILHPCNLPHPT